MKLNNKRTDAKEGVNCSPFSHIIDLQTGADAITIRSAYKSIIVFRFFFEGGGFPPRFQSNTHY
jgi:hypothetical protein